MDDLAELRKALSTGTFHVCPRCLGSNLEPTVVFGNAFQFLKMDEAEQCFRLGLALVHLHRNVGASGHHHGFFVLRLEGHGFSKGGRKTDAHIAGFVTP